MSIVLTSGSLNLLEPSGPVQACNGIGLPLPLTLPLPLPLIVFFEAVAAQNVVRFTDPKSSSEGRLM